MTIQRKKRSKYEKYKKTPYKQGIYELSEEQKKKYCGTYPIIYRSSLEMKFLHWCVNSPSVVSFASESHVVPYRKPCTGKIHRYFLDFFIELTNGKKYLVEVKPHSQTLPPKTTNRKNKMALLNEQITWSTNNAKWEAAKKWANIKGWEFIIVTDRMINKKG